MFDLKKKLNKHDIVFAAVIFLLTALLMLLPSKLGTKGTSPGYSALNAILLTSNCTDITYEKYEPQAVAVLFQALNNDLDDAGLKLWHTFVRERFIK